MAKAEHRIEECLQRAKSEAGLGDYEVRHWKGWHHHQEPVADRLVVFGPLKSGGKKMDSRDYRATDSQRHRADSSSAPSMRYPITSSLSVRATSQAQSARSPVSLESA